MAGKTKLGRVVSAAMVVALLYVLFYSYIGLSGETLAVVKSAAWGFLGIAAVCQIAYFFIYALLYKKCFKIYGINWKFWDFLKLFLATIFSSLISFVGGALAGGLFLRKAKKEAVPAGPVINALFLVNLADFALLFILLLIGIPFLITGRDVSGYEIVGFLSFALLILALVFVLVVGNFRPGLLAKFFGLIRLIVNRGAKIFASKLRIAEPWPEEMCAEFGVISRQLTKDKSDLANIAMVSFFAHAANALTLFFCFLAFGYRAEWEAVVSGYGMGMIFTTISVTPQGLGVVDGVIPAIFKSFGASFRVAALAVFAFRLLSLWLPALFGFFTFNKLARTSPKNEEVAN